MEIIFTRPSQYNKCNGWTYDYDNGLSNCAKSVNDLAQINAIYRLTASHTLFVAPANNWYPSDWPVSCNCSAREILSGILHRKTQLQRPTTQI